MRTKTHKRTRYVPINPSHETNFQPTMFMDAAFVLIVDWLDGKSKMP